MPGQDPRDTTELLLLVRDGDQTAAGALFDLHRKRLETMVRIRLDRRVRARLGVSDVIQDVHAEAVRRLPKYLAKPDMPFFLWLRFLTSQRMALACREHLGVQARDVRREVPLDRAGRPGVTSVVLAQQLAARVTAPSQAAMRKELRGRLNAALDTMDELDREIISLRHFEQLTNAEIATELGIGVSAASKRYIRAFRRLRELMSTVPGWTNEGRL